MKKKVKIASASFASVLVSSAKCVLLSSKKSKITTTVNVLLLLLSHLCTDFSLQTL